MRVMLVGVFCGLAVLQLGWIAGAQTLPPLQFTGDGVVGVHRVCDDCSDSVQLNISFPFGDYCHTVCHVSDCIHQC